MPMTALCVAMVVATTVAQVCPEPAARWSRGSVRAAAAEGTVGVLLSGSALVVVDLADPAAPEVVAETALPGVGEDVVIEQARAWVATTSGVGVYDLSTPAAPVEIGRLELAAVPSHLTLDGPVLYVTSDFGLHVIDVADPGLPRIVGGDRFPGDEYEVNNRPLAVAGGVLCVSTYGGHDPLSMLRVYSVADPWSPQLIASWYGLSEGEAVTMTPTGGHLVLTTSVESLVFELSDPASPRQVATIAVRAEAAVLGGGRLVLAGGSLHVVDLADPAAPEVLGSVGLPGWAFDVALTEGGLAVAALGPDGMAAVELGDGQEPVVTATVRFPGPVSFEDVVERDGVIYVASGDSMSTFETASGGGIELLAGVPLAGSQIRLSGSTAYLGAWSTVHALDVADPRDPRLLGSFTVGPGGPRPEAFAVEGDRVLVAVGTFLHVLDFSDPFAPRELSVTEMSAYARSLAIESDLVVVGSESPVGVLLIRMAADGSVREIGWSEPPDPPLQPPLIFDGWGGVSHVDVEGDRVGAVYCEFVPIFGGDPPLCTLTLIDVSSPELPATIGQTTWLSDDDFRPEVRLEDPLAVVTRPGLLVVSVHDPTRPELIAGFETTGAPTGVSLHGTTAVVAGGAAGLEVLELRPCSHLRWSRVHLPREVE
jgi:hypothetical protein